MTANLRDRMAAEIAHLEPIEDLAPGTIRLGRTTVRRRRTAVGALAAAGVVAGATWAGYGPGGFSSADDSNLVADRSESRATDVTLHAQWDRQLSHLFSAHLPEGFNAEVTQSGGDRDGGALQFVASGPGGQVQLNATVYLDASLPMPECNHATASKCRKVVTPAGTATLLQDAYDAADLPGGSQDRTTRRFVNASQIWIDDARVQTIVNFVEVNPGSSQYSMRDLVRFARDESLLEVVDFAYAHADDLKDYAVIRPGLNS